MNVSTKLCVPDEATASLTITGTIKELKEMREELMRNNVGTWHPIFSLKTTLSNVIGESSRTWSQEVEEKPE